MMMKLQPGCNVVEHERSAFAKVLLVQAAAS